MPVGLFHYMYNTTIKYKIYKFIQNIQIHTIYTNSYKIYKFIQNIQIHTKYTTSYKRYKFIQNIQIDTKKYIMQDSSK